MDRAQPAPRQLRALRSGHARGGLVPRRLDRRGLRRVRVAGRLPRQDHPERRHGQGEGMHQRVPGPHTGGAHGAGAGAGLGAGQGVQLQMRRRRPNRPVLQIPARHLLPLSHNIRGYGRCVRAFTHARSSISQKPRRVQHRRCGDFANTREGVRGHS